MKRGKKEKYSLIFKNTNWDNSTFQSKVGSRCLGTIISKNDLNKIILQNFLTFYYELILIIYHNNLLLYLSTIKTYEKDKRKLLKLMSENLR